MEISRREFVGHMLTALGLVTTTQQGLTPEQVARFRADWEACYTGDNAGKVVILDPGLTYEPITVSGADAQWLEQRQWQA